MLADRLAELYEVTFPDHPEWLDEEVVDWEEEEDVAGAVETFLGRVSLLFPVQDDIWEVYPSAGSGQVSEAVEWRLWEIPLIPMGYDLYDDEWEDLKEPAAYLLYMSHYRYDAGGAVRHDDFAARYPNHLVPRNLEPASLVDSLRQVCTERRNVVEQGQTTEDNQLLPEPLDALADLIAMLDQNTGNAWLDIGEMSLAEGGGYPVWSRENVEWLAAEWQKAKPVLEGIHRLLDWQNESEEEIDDKLTAVRDVLLEAYNRTQEEAELPEPKVTS
jgi:hypothetical protein